MTHGMTREARRSAPSRKANSSLKRPSRKRHSGVDARLRRAADRGLVLASRARGRHAVHGRDCRTLSAGPDYADLRDAGR